MPASVNAGLLLVTMLIAILLPIFTFAKTLESDDSKWVGIGFVAWLPFVFFWAVLHLRLIALKPEWYGEGPLDVVTGWAVFLGIVAALFGFIFSLLRNVD